MPERLTLSNAIKAGRLQDFIAQEEVRDGSPANKNHFDTLINTAVKPRRSEDQTSGSRGPDDSTGK